jgi:sulfite exporter TauE/SafE
MGALTFSLTPEVRERPARLSGFLLAYNLGRIGSYAVAGAAVGAMGGGLYRMLPAGGHLFLQAMAAALMVGIGLYLAGWFPRFAAIERIGIPLWRRLEPVGRRFLPVRHPGLAFIYGTIWGWLPCGLVYSALLLTVTSGGPLQGALFMTAFGAGTLPAVLGAGILTRQLQHLTRNPRVRQGAGLTLMIIALAGFLFADQLHLSTPFSSEQEFLQCRD